jgi:hypothetical protein
LESETIAQFRYARHRYTPPTNDSRASAAKRKKSNLAKPDDKSNTAPKPNIAARMARPRNAAVSLNMVRFSFEQVTLGSVKKRFRLPYTLRGRFKATSGDRRCGVFQRTIRLVTCLDLLPYLQTVDRNPRIDLEAESNAAILEFEYCDFEQALEAGRSADHD